MKYIAITAILVISLYGSITVFCEEEEFIICYVDRFPFHYMENGIIKGLIAEPTDYAFKKSGFSYKWQETPAKRMMILVQQNQHKVVMAGWFKNPEREKIGKFSSPVYQDRFHKVIIRKGNEKMEKINSFKSLLADKNLTLLVKDGYSYGKAFDSMIIRNNTNLHKVTVGMEKMVLMVQSGRGDYMFSTAEEGEYLIKLSGVDRNSVILRDFPDSPEGEFRYLLFSKKVSDEEIKVINRHLRDFRFFKK